MNELQLDAQCLRQKHSSAILLFGIFNNLTAKCALLS